MTPITKDYRTARAPGAVFAIILTIGVNIGLFCVLGWVNRRPAHLEKAATIVKSHHLKLHTPPPVKERKKEFKLRDEKRPQQKKVRPKPRHFAARPPALKRPSVTPQHVSVSLTLPELRFAPTITELVHTDSHASPSTELIQGNGIADESEVDTPPRTIYSPSPHYPLSARRLGYTGNVKLSLIITKEGRARDLKVLGSSGHRSLDESAMRTVRTWRFQPAADKGVQVDVSGTVQFNFQLEKKR